MPGRVEALAGRVVGLDAGARERRRAARGRRARRPAASASWAETSWLDGSPPRSRGPAGIDPGGQQRPLEVVERRQQLAGERRLAAALGVGGVAGRALAVVLEVGPGPLRQLEVLVALALGLLEQRVEVARDAGSPSRPSGSLDDLGVGRRPRRPPALGVRRRRPPRRSPRRSSLSASPSRLRRGRRRRPRRRRPPPRRRRAGAVARRRRAAAGAPAAPARPA